MESEFSIADIANITKRSKVTVYKLARKLGRIPTIEEVLKRKNGRPKKYF